MVASNPAITIDLRKNPAGVVSARLPASKEHGKVERFPYAPL